MGLGSIKGLSFLVLTAAFAFSLVAEGAGPAARSNARRAGPKFKLPIELNGKLGTPFDVKLRSLLTDPNFPGQLNWKIDKNPSWMSIDAANESLVGTPTAAGNHSFEITVESNDGGDRRPGVFRVPAPPIFAQSPVDLGIWKEDEQRSFELLDVIQNPAGGAVTFSVTGLPSWLSLSGTKLVGTPRREHVGDFNGITITAKGIGGESQAPARGTVVKTIKWPKWVSKDIQVPDAQEDFTYDVELMPFVKNEEGAAAKIRFEIVSETPPPWLKRPTTGRLIGIPKRENVGVNTVALRLIAQIDGEERDDVANFTINVLKTNHAPKWSSKQITLPGGTSGSAVSANLSGSVSDPDGDKLSFEIISSTGPGSSWASIDKNTGVLSGTPQKANVGPWTFVVSAKDPEGLSDTTTVTISIKKANEPPKWKSNPLVLDEGEEGKSYLVDLNEFVTDPDSDKLTFTKLDGAPAWVSVSPTGILSGNPTEDDIGLHTFRVKADDRISGSDTTLVHILIKNVNHAPKWVMNPLEAQAKEDSLFELNLKLYVEDKDKGDTLTFSKVFGPNWAEVTPDGKFSGTPRHGNDGKNEFKIRVADSKGLFAAPDLTLVVFVQHVNHKPYWNEPVVLSNAKEDAPYSGNIAAFAKDPDDDTLTFSKVSGPQWLIVSGDGSLGGSPVRKDVGTYDVQLRVTDPSGESAVTSTRITVEQVNKPPYWRQNPVQLGQFKEDGTAKFHFLEPVAYAVDPDNDPLTFKLISYEGPGSSWVFVGEKGDLTGVPTKEHIGKFTITVEVADNHGHAVQAKATGEVIHVNHPPIINQGIVFKIDEDKIFTVDVVDPKYVSDPDNDKLSFVLETPSDFVTLFSDGKLKAEPKYKHVGKHEFSIRVNDGQIAIHGKLLVEVSRVASPPIWLQDPISMEAKTNEALSASIAGFAKEADGIPLTFSKKTGPAWLTVSPSGELSGMPKDTDMGPNAFVVTACNDKLCTDAKLNIQVKPGTQKDTVQLDTAVPGAPVELLWVVDNSCGGSGRIKDEDVVRHLKQSIFQFFTGLGSVHHAGVYISSDEYQHKALPLYDKNQEILMLWSTPNLGADFGRRADLGVSSGPCHKSSPTYSMFRFYEQLPSISKIYHNGYMMAEVPMEVMIVTPNPDEYPWYTKKIPALKDYTPELFARDFIDLHVAEKKPYRISAIAKSKPPTRSEESDEENEASERCTKTPGPEYTYRTLVDRTKGKYYTLDKSFDMASVMKDYAKAVAFRANVNAKKRIPLSKTPLDSSTIIVTLAGWKLGSDKWRYDAGTNEVIIYWHLIDQGTLKPTDVLEIQYRIS